MRELQNEIERVVLLTEPDHEISPEYLSDTISQRVRPTARAHGNLKTAVQMLEDEMIREAMQRFRHNKSRTARALGISRQSLIEKLRRLNLSAI